MATRMKLNTNKTAAALHATEQLLRIHIGPLTNSPSSRGAAFTVPSSISSILMSSNAISEAVSWKLSKLVSKSDVTFISSIVGSVFSGTHFTLGVIDRLKLGRELLAGRLIVVAVNVHVFRRVVLDSTVLVWYEMFVFVRGSRRLFHAWTR